MAQKLSGQVNGEQASVAAARAQLATAKAQVDLSRADLANAQWNLDQTSVYAPASGYAINVQLRPGSYVTRVSGGPGDELRRGDLSGHRALRAERAAAGRARQRSGVRAEHATPGASSRRRSIRSSGRRARGRWRSRARCRRPAPFRRCRAGSRSSSTSTSATASCSSRPARTGTARSTPSTRRMIHLVRMVILRVGSITDYLVLKLH